MSAAPAELDAGVGVDPGALGLGDRIGSVEGVPAGVAQEVPERAARLADGIVEVEGSFLDGDEDRPGHERLGDRGEPEGAGRVTDRVDHLARLDDRRADMVDRPVGGEVEGSHRCPSTLR